MRSKRPLMVIAVAALAFGVALAFAGASWGGVVLGTALALCVLLGAWMLWVAYRVEREKVESAHDAPRGGRER